MSKKQRSRKSDRSSLSSPASEIRRLNEQIAQLCNQRAELASQAADDSVASLLEAGQLAQVLAKQTGPLPAEALQAVFRELDSATCALIRQVRVAFLGPEFSYTHLAAIQRFGQGCELMPVGTIGAVFEAVQRGDAEFGVVPIENSTDGRIVDTLDMFSKMQVRICGEVPIPIHHNLLGSGKLADVREVQSKPQALSQCRNWLSTQLPKAKLVPTTSTTVAAENAAANQQVAAVASRQAAVHYGLSVLAAEIEDNPDNVTRFVVIGMQPAARTGHDKTSIMFELSHQPGALADAMVVFRRNQLNLTWIESFPKKGCKNEYLFFVEFEGHPEDPSVRRAIKALEKVTTKIVMLGAYAASDEPRR